jgi:hypothetical protein
MQSLRTNSITIRKESFTVSELTAKQMANVRKIMKDEPHRLDAVVASMACQSPTFTELAILDLPNVFAKGIAAEALRLSADDEDAEDPKTPAG